MLCRMLSQKCDQTNKQAMTCQETLYLHLYVCMYVCIYQEKQKQTNPRTKDQENI